VDAARAGTLPRTRLVGIEPKRVRTGEQRVLLPDERQERRTRGGIVLQARHERDTAI